MASFYESVREKDKTHFIVNLAKKQLSCEKHFHSNIELIFVLDGEATAIVNKKTYNLKKNDLCLILGYEEHEFVVDDFCNCYNLIIPEFMIRSFLAFIDKRTLVTHIFPPNEFSLIIESCLRNLLLPNHPLASKGYIYTILGHILHLAEFEYDHFSSGEKTVVTTAIEYINSNYLENITMESLAARVGYSTANFSTLFNKVVGCGFKDYLNNLRINHANYLFSQGENNILNVAINSGFNSIRTFNRVYKNKMGVTPRDYLNNKVFPLSKIQVGEHITLANMRVYTTTPETNNKNILWQWISRMPSSRNVSHKIVDVNEKITGVPIGIKTTFLNSLSYDASYYQDDNYNIPIDLSPDFDNTYISFFIKTSAKLKNVQFKITCGNRSWTSFCSKIFSVHGSEKWQEVTIKLSDMLGASAFDKENFIFVWLQPAENALSSSLTIR